MALCIELPSDVEQKLRADLGDLDSAAKEACLVEFYRQGQLSHAQFAAALGIGRYEADGVLKRHGVLLELSAEEAQRQVEMLSKQARPR